LFVTIVFTVNTVLSLEYDSNTSNPPNSELKVQTEVIDENPVIKESFYKIAALEYNEKRCNCKHKSEAFARVLSENKVENTQIVSIEHESGKYSHMMVLWDGRIYDATIVPPVYGMAAGEYFNKIKKYGFNGLRFTAPYTAT